MRPSVIHAVIIVFFLLLGLGAFSLQIAQGSKLKDLSDKNSVRLSQQMGARGRIMDCKGKVIVDSYLSYDLMLTPQKGQEFNDTMERISRVLGVSREELIANYKRNFIANSLPVNIFMNIPVRQAIALEELKSDYNGIVVDPHPLRNYPLGSLASHVVGYLNEIDLWRLTKLEDYGYKTRDIVGYTGIEERYDYYLRQQVGGLSMEVDHRGKFVRLLGFKPPGNGKDIQLTLDAGIQKIVEDNLVERNAAVVLMDPFTGEVIALASSPGFDPSAFMKKSNGGSADFFSNPNSPLLNRAIGGVFPPASVFKLVVAAAALEMGKINPSTTYNCPGYTNIGKKRFGCWETHGDENLTQAIAHSCDVFFYHTGLLVGAQGLHDYAQKFGFGKTTAIDIPYEASGLVPDPLWKKIYRFQKWFDGDTANFSIGQGDLLVTPIQVVRMVAVFANNGSLVSPYIVKAIDGRDVSGSKRHLVRIGLKNSTLDYIREGLREVGLPGGTGSLFSDLPVAVAGKTGTAQVGRGVAHAWFAGYFPCDNPKYAICVFIEHGGSGTAACALTKHVIQDMIKQDLL